MPCFERYFSKTSVNCLSDKGSKRFRFLAIVFGLSILLIFSICDYLDLGLTEPVR